MGAKDYNMTLEQLRKIAEKVYIKRRGNYNELCLHSDGGVIARIGYSYKDLIGLDNGSGDVWIATVHHSNATRQHIELFKKGVQA